MNGDRYRANEFGRYEPPGCPRCGVRAEVTTWLNVTYVSDREQMFMPGLLRCNTTGCDGGNSNSRPA